MRKLILLATCVLMLLALSSVPFAQCDTILEGSLVSITAQTATGEKATLTFDVPSDISNQLSQPYQWSLDGTRSFASGDKVLGELQNLMIAVDPDPVVTLGFLVTAGSADTTFTISSATLSFPTIDPAQAYASAGVTLTGDSDGATVTGNLNGECYEAKYNGTTLFDDLVPGFSVGQTTLTNSERSPVGTGWTTIGSAGSMAASWNFTLSALDTASGTSRYEILPVPEPGSLLGLACGLFALGGILRRRR